MADNEQVTPEQEFIYVTGGPRLADGQVAIAEASDEHPWVPSPNPLATGQKQAFIVKGDPRVGSGYVGMSSRVAEKLAANELVRATPAAGTPEPLRERPTGAAYAEAVASVQGGAGAAVDAALASGPIADAIARAVERGITAALSALQGAAAPVAYPPAQPIGEAPAGGDDLSRRTKAELLDIAHDRGVSVRESDTKADIVAAIEGAGGGEAGAGATGGFGGEAGSVDSGTADSSGVPQE